MSDTARTETLRDFEGQYVEDGYSFIEVGIENGWQTVAGWGRDGWDLGDWPYMVYMFRGDLERASYCEGDIVIEVFPTTEERERATDEAAFWTWRNNGEEWIEGIKPGEEPDYLRGRFSWARLKESEQQTV